MSLCTGDSDSDSDSDSDGDSDSDSDSDSDGDSDSDSDSDSDRSQPCARLPYYLHAGLQHNYAYTLQITKHRW